MFLLRCLLLDMQRTEETRNHTKMNLKACKENLFTGFCFYTSLKSIPKSIAPLNPILNQFGL